MDFSLKRTWFFTIAAILAVIALAGLLALKWNTVSTFFAGKAPALRPHDLVIQSDQRRYDEKIGPPKTPGPVDRAFIRALEPAELTSASLRFDLTSYTLPSGPRISSSDVRYVIRPLSLNALPTSGPYVEPVALGIARIDYLTSEPLAKWKRNGGIQTPYVYYDLDGQRLDALNIPFQNQPCMQRNYLQANRIGLQIVYDIFNVDHPRHVGSYLYDAQTLASLSSGSSWHHSRENPHMVSHDLKLYHPAQMGWMVDIAHGPLQTIEIPLEKNAEADFGDVFVRVLTDPVNGYSNGSSSGNNSVEYRFMPGHRNQHQYVTVGMSPQSMGRLVTAQFLDDEGDPIGTETNIYANNYIQILSNYSSNKAAALRINRYAGVMRFTLELGEMPDTPEVNDQVRDLMDVRIPWVFVKNSQDAWDVIEDVTQMDVRMGTHISWGVKMPKTEYYDITPLELLKAQMVLAPPDVELIIDTDRGAITLDKPKPFHERASDWIKGLF